MSLFHYDELFTLQYDKMNELSFSLNRYKMLTS